MVRKNNEKGKFYLKLYSSPHWLMGEGGYFSLTFLKVFAKKRILRVVLSQ